jgi:hypothetical protein
MLSKLNWRDHKKYPCILYIRVFFCFLDGRKKRHSLLVAAFIVCGQQFISLAQSSMSYRDFDDLGGSVRLSDPSYYADGDIIYLQAGAIENYSDYPTRNLILSLWATKQIYSGGDLTGYLLAEANVGRLVGYLGFYNFSAPAAYSAPPQSDYYLTMVLSEYQLFNWTGTDYEVIDYKRFDGVQTFGVEPNMLIHNFWGYRLAGLNQIDPGDFFPCNFLAAIKGVTPLLPTARGCLSGPMTG